MKPFDSSGTAKAFKSGFVAIIGAPNAGKSTLLNRLLGQKISITSKKPQTTRNRILGVVDRPDAQLVLLDTPGIHRTAQLLHSRIVDVALSVLADVDLVLILADASAPDPESEHYLLDKLKDVTKPVMLALNKIDRTKKTELLRQMERWSQSFDFRSIIPISALTGDQVDPLVDAMTGAMAEGPALFPPDSLTDMPERFIVGEIIREKAFRLTGEEIPYAVAVTVESFKEEKGGRLVRIHATIHVERNSQKGIVIGNSGRKLKQIGEAARLDIQRLLGTPVFLKLFVRVQKNWTKDSKALRRFGY